jgi:hypothetical protein
MDIKNPLLLRNNAGSAGICELLNTTIKTTTNADGRAFPIVKHPISDWAMFVISLKRNLHE